MTVPSRARHPRRIGAARRHPRPARRPRAGPSTPDPRPPAPQRDRGERPPRRHRRGRRRRPAHPRSSATRTGSSPCARRSSRSALARPDRGRRDRGVRPRAGRDRDHGELAFGRGPPRPDAPGRSTGGPASARRSSRCGSEGDAARRADRGAPRPRRREGRPGPPHVLGPAHGVPAALAGCSGWDPTTTGRPSHPGAGRLPGGRRPGLRDDAGASSRPRSTAAASRPTRSRCARSPAPTRCSPTRRPSRRATRAASLAPALTIDPRRDARQPRDGRRAPRPARHLADEGRARAASSARAGWRRCAGSAILPGAAERHARRRRVAASPSRSRTATATSAAPGRRRSRRCARPACSTAQALRDARPLPPAGDPRPARPGRRRGDRRVRARTGRRADRLSRTRGGALGPTRDASTRRGILGR